MKTLDDGHALSAVAANFIASPEFQRTHGSLNGSQFVTQLYQNVLPRTCVTGRRAPTCWWVSVNHRRTRQR